jgi:hypothetical protein
VLVQTGSKPRCSVVSLSCTAVALEQTCLVLMLHRCHPASASAAKHQDHNHDAAVLPLLLP